MRNNWHPLFLVFLTLSIFGFLFHLITNPLSFLSEILIYAGLILVFYAIYKYVLLPKVPQNRAHQTQRFKQPNQPGLNHFQARSTVTEIKSTLRKKRKEHPFRVIEGNKGKKKKPFSS